MPLSRTRHIICLVTDRRRLAAPAAVVSLVSEAAKAGIDLIQIRERDLEAAELTGLVRQCVAAAEGTAAKIVVNDRVDVALAAGAHGVHLRGTSVEARRVREIVPPDFIVGRSVHGVEEAAAASRAGGLDYLILGTLFPTASKESPFRLTTMTGLAAACALTSIPVLAIGGMTVERAEDVARTGAAGVAAIGLFLPPAGVPLDRHLHVCVAQLRRVFDTCGAVP